ncbi:MAG: F0F1 ATP synthase subunit delta [Paludibacteraceae bacterium]|nr:F0F1 ATP synthase subunit delta [Paludibacteraceae bacterium]
MNHGKISIRYARALYEYALEHQEDKAVYADMQMLARTAAEVKGMTVFLANPAAGRQDKLNLLQEASGGKKTCATTRHFLEFVLDKNRESSMQMIALMYAKLYREKNHIRLGQVTSAAELPARTLDKISAFIRDNYHVSVEMSTRIDPAIIGGFILDIDDNRFDASISGQLQKLNNYAGH